MVCLFFSLTKVSPIFRKGIFHSHIHSIKQKCYRPNRIRIKFCDTNMFVRYYITQWLLKRWRTKAGTTQILLHHKYGTYMFPSGHCRLSTRKILSQRQSFCHYYIGKLRGITILFNLQYHLYNDDFEEVERTETINQSATCLNET